MKKQILHVFPGIWPGGGPAGYAYHLRGALDLEVDLSFIQMLFPISPLYKPPTDKQRQFSLYARFKQKSRELFPRVYGVIVVGIGYTQFKHILSWFSHSHLLEMKTSQVLVFHEWRLAYAYLNKIGRKKGQQIFLMPHSPVEWAREYADSLRYHYGDSLLWKYVYHFYLQKEKEVWLALDGFILPSRYSLEGYLNGCLYNLIGSIPIIEIPTGIRESTVSRSSQDTQKVWGVSPNVKICGFFGRRHPHKGYDIFCQLARRALEKQMGLTFVSAGNGPLPWPNLPNYIHLGYVDGGEIADTIAACDIVIVPNRVNYFDLVILEAMCLGKPVITTHVGGAKSIVSPGVLFVELSESIVDNILSIITHLISDDDTLLKAGQANRIVYEKEFSASAFLERHRKMTIKLLGDV